jgi:hypothetical protein
VNQATLSMRPLLEVFVDAFEHVSLFSHAAELRACYSGDVSLAMAVG